MKRAMLVLFAAMMLLPAGVAGAAGTAVPGHSGPKVDKNGNGYPDEGVVVNGHYNSLYAYDITGAYYWDLGDGRVYTSPGVKSPADLDQATLTECVYVVNYRGRFEDDPFQDSGVIANQIRCHGYEKGTFNYQIVHESDPRYRGNPEWAIWENWEYHVLTESGMGNLVRPTTHVG